MNVVVNKMLKHMALEGGEWSEIEWMKMRLGFQVLIHNIIMIGSILLLAELNGIFIDSVILLISYGLLKLTAGGIHFEKSLICLLSTSAFVISGVTITKYIRISIYGVLLIYVLCMFILWLIGPQGTENNPISPQYYYKLRRDTMIITSVYLLITIYKFVVGQKIPYLLLVAVVFETTSLLPNKIKSRC